MKLLWLKSELLHPVDKGGKIRTYQMLRELKRLHEVTYLAPVSPDDEPEAVELAREYCHRLVAVQSGPTKKNGASLYGDLFRNLFSPLPYAIEKYRSAEIRRQIEIEMQDASYDVVVCDFLVPSINLPQQLGRPKVLFQHNVESLIWRRHFETQENNVKKAYFRQQWEKMLEYEGRVSRQFDAVVAVSAVDRDFLRYQYGAREVYDVPTGVDAKYFRPLGGRDRNSREIVFTGSMDWLPNEDAIVNFIEEILPRVAEAIPGVKLKVVGRNPSARLRSLAERCGRVEVTGRVEDVRPYIDRAAVYVVPLRIGGGTRLKIFEAMAMGKPIVSTTIGSEGLPVRNGEHLLIADGAEEFASAIVRLFSDQHLAQALARAARSLVWEQFGWDKAAAAFARVCARVANKEARTQVA
ncbi:MAG: hypothetical protein DMF61_04060 [Blastocatellia bacterium AA13]|nr:MAG: hypothetical protein DMF61_04060 [Blastocatellia bacterium AA13]